MAYLVFDLETQTHTFLKRKASPWHPDNYIVAIGWKKQGDAKCSYTYYDRQGTHYLHIPEDITLLVGFNLKFDLLWQWDNPELKAFFKRGGKIWDCQYVEYLIHGMDSKYHFVSLTDTAPRYGGIKKIDEVKILWDRGMQTSEISKDLLIDYLVGTVEEGRNAGDIGNTEKIFLGQVAKVRELDMLEAVWSRMDGLCATTEMEWNGLKIDVDEARKQLIELRTEMEAKYEELQTLVPELPEGLEFNWGSRTHKSCLIFGGTVKYQKKSTYMDPKTGDLARLVAQEDWPLFNGEPINPKDTYTVDGIHYMDVEVLSKNGKMIDEFWMQDTYTGGKRKGEGKFKKVKVQGELKTKLCDFYFKFPGYVQPQADWATKSLDGAGKPLYSTSGETIELLEAFNVPFCKVLTRYEALSKELGTYFVTRDAEGNMTGMLTCVNPETKMVHQKKNHTSTVTSRLSAQDPNLENLPRKDKSKIKRLFVSRFGEDGLMVEADYKQLEVVVQGVLSGDKQLCEDLRNRVDFHCKRIAIQPKYGVTYEQVLELCSNENGPDYYKWKAIRTNTKIFSFQRAYGAGAVLIAASTGMTVEEVQELIKAEEAYYPGVVEFNKAVERSVAETAKPFRDFMNGNKVYRRGYWTAPTKCVYSFRSWDAPDYVKRRGIDENFSPTEMKNYPVQGTGGEIMQGGFGKLWRHLVQNDNYGGKALLCNTVHDCIWVDTHKDVTQQVCKDVKEILEDVPNWFLKFGVKITVPFPVDVEVGPNMLDLKHA